MTDLEAEYMRERVAGGSEADAVRAVGIRFGLDERTVIRCLRRAEHTAVMRDAGEARVGGHAQ